MIIKAIALDDEPPALRVLENFCARAESVDLRQTFTQPKAALRYLLESPVDLLFLDIRMPSQSGIEFYKAVDPKTRVVFTTAYSDYAVEGFNLNATDYLLKPFSFERFMQALDKVREQLKAAGPTAATLFVRSEYSLVKISIPDILYIESQDDYLKIHLENTRPVVTRMTLKTMLDKLPETEFVRVHRSFVVALSRVEYLRNRMIGIAGISVPLSDSYYRDFQERFRQGT